jgi:L-seryl-tRNA(Ser) seleniumtransferase
MVDSASLLRRLPSVGEVLAHPRVAGLAEAGPHGLARQAAREAVEEARARAQESGKAPELEAIAGRAARILQGKLTRSLRRVVNATGVVLHTGLGRAPLSEAAQEALAEAASGYCNVQTELESGERMPREAHVQWLLQELTGAQAALVVNNNAAATVLVLNALAAGREVIVSRGEMVEIGGSFRLPDIIELSGCRLVEVGCTNRTHLRDYEGAITPETALLLSVHQSNYRIEGFSSQVEVGELVELAHARGLPCVHDLGSGALVAFERYGLPHEPSAPESLAAGADAVLFSGDKLLGGPQCGIILGEAELLGRMRRNPFYRAFRVGKLTLSALEATLRLFLDADSLPERHRVTSLLALPVERISGRAEALAGEIRARCGGWLTAETQADESQVGGGSLAGHALPTVVVRAQSDRIAAGDLARRLRLGDPPVFTRVRDDSVRLDPRTMLPEEDEVVVEALARIGAELRADEADRCDDT